MSVVACNRGSKTDDAMANGNLNTIEQGSKVAQYVNDVEYRPNSREELLRHENLVMRVVQNDGYRTKFGKLVIWR